MPCSHCKTFRDDKPIKPKLCAPNFSQHTGPEAYECQSLWVEVLAPGKRKRVDPVRVPVPKKKAASRARKKKKTAKLVPSDKPQCTAPSPAAVTPSTTEKDVPPPTPVVSLPTEVDISFETDASVATNSINELSTNSYENEFELLKGSICDLEKSNISLKKVNKKLVYCNAWLQRRNHGLRVQNIDLKNKSESSQNKANKAESELVEFKRDFFQKTLHLH